MNYFTFIYGMTLIVYLSILMGMILRWALNSDPVSKKNWGRAWHGWMALTRLGGVVVWIPFFWNQWHLIALFVLISANLSWTFYDGICNWFRKLSFWYIGSSSSGTGSWWDKLWTVKSSKIVKIILMVITIAYTIVYIILLKS